MSCHGKSPGTGSVKDPNFGAGLVSGTAQMAFEHTTSTLHLFDIMGALDRQRLKKSTVICCKTQIEPNGAFLFRLLKRNALDECEQRSIVISLTVSYF